METRLSLERPALLVSLRTRPSTGVIINFPPELRVSSVTPQGRGVEEGRGSGQSLLLGLWK